MQVTNSESSQTGRTRSPSLPQERMSFNRGAGIGRTGLLNISEAPTNPVGEFHQSRRVARLLVELQKPNTNRSSV